MSTLSGRMIFIHYKRLGTNPWLPSNNISLFSLYNFGPIVYEDYRRVERSAFLVVNPFVRKCVLDLAMYLISSFKKRENRVE